MSRIRILVADDREGARQGMAAVFAASQPFHFIDAVALKMGVQTAGKHQPDVILVGIPEELDEAKRVISAFKEACPFSLTIAIGCGLQTPSFCELILVGLDGYLPQHLLPGDMTKAVQLSCHSRMLCFPRACLDSNNISADKNHSAPPGQNPDSILTEREREVFKLVVQNYSNKRIASCLFISEPTVKSHIRSIFHKLGVKNRMEAVLLGMHGSKSMRDDAMTINC